MAIPIEGFTVVALKSRIDSFLENESFEIPNATALGDDDIWRCSFMAESDALDFVKVLAALELNVAQGPDSDVVLVSEFDRSIDPYCEWLQTAQWEKAVIAWKAGTRPETIVAREGWDPKVGSGLVFQDPDAMDHLEFVRVKDGIEVYRDKRTGKEHYLSRTSNSIEAMFTDATETIRKHLVTAGERPVTGTYAKDVTKAVEMLKKVIDETPDAWNALWFLGKGQLALGDAEAALLSFRKAYELEKNVEMLPRELAGVCLELGRFDEAESVAEQAVALDPENPGLIGNLALAYLLAGRHAEAHKSIAAALKLDDSDRINQNLRKIIQEVVDGRRPQPTSIASLSKPLKPKKKSWQFWKN